LWVRGNRPTAIERRAALTHRGKVEGEVEASPQGRPHPSIPPLARGDHNPRATTAVVDMREVVGRLLRAKGYGQGLWPRAMAKGYGQGLWPRAMAKGYGQGLWPRAMAKGYGSGGVERASYSASFDKPPTLGLRG
jgi:hypothetical protein